MVCHCAGPHDGHHSGPDPVHDGLAAHRRRSSGRTNRGTASGSATAIAWPAVRRRSSNSTGSCGCGAVCWRTLCEIVTHHRTGRGPNVTWYAAAAYCNWLSEQEGIPARAMVLRAQCRRPVRARHADGRSATWIAAAIACRRKPSGSSRAARARRPVATSATARRGSTAMPCSRPTRLGRAAGGHPQAQRLRTLRHAG